MAKVFAARSMRIAVQGSGVAAASCAQRLSSAHTVTVFESGRGPGGRTSTRRSGAYQWDHGAQYFTPKTDEFAGAVDEWRASGSCEVWEAAHCVWSADGGVSPDPMAGTNKRYVGSPGMNAICKGLLSEVDETRYETRAAAKRNERTGGWALTHAKTGAALGEFDFLICTDKTAALRHRSDLDQDLLRGFVAPASAVRSHPSLALMVATTATRLKFDSLLLDDHKAFSWLARDDSKPGRPRVDGVECWVAHASPGFTQRLLDASKKESRRKRSPNALRSAIVRGLLPQFEALVSELGGGRGRGGDLKVLVAQGHRWGGAFPVAPFGGASGARDGPFYLDREHAFGACGDFFSPFPGRVEGAWVSGTSLASDLLLSGKS